MEEDVPRPGKAKVRYPATIRAILANKVYTEVNIFLERQGRKGSAHKGTGWKKNHS